MMGRQKVLELSTGGKAQQAPELGFPQRPRLICTEGISFEDMTGDILSRGLSHLLGDIVRDI
jgi:hypothetical protein